MPVDPKYKLGQVVYYARDAVGTGRVDFVETSPCKFCDGVGQIEHRGEQLTCPKCYGPRHLGAVYLKAAKKGYVTGALLGPKGMKGGMLYIVSSRPLYTAAGYEAPQEEVFTTKKAAVAFCKKDNSANIERKAKSLESRKLKFKQVFHKR